MNGYVICLPIRGGNTCVSLNGRTSKRRSANISWRSAIWADRRLHGTTRKTPLELHAEELSHLLPLPNLEFDKSQVVYRSVASVGTIRYENNRYSVPWQLAGDLLPVRITERSLIVYGRHLSLVAEHRLVQGLRTVIASGS